MSRSNRWGLKPPPWHSAGTLPLTDTNPQNGERGQQALNSVDYNPLLRALLVQMDRWVSQGEAPPASRYPLPGRRQRRRTRRR